ncbi:hypothetical protein, partial [Methanocalculus natronophilus]|uniref:hypothetical protein n=1 Tax=Methanocalculus natronophilus TaxID=1262400 RepID=UPI0031B5BD38
AEFRAHFDTHNVISTTLSADFGTHLKLDGSLAENEDYVFAYWIVNGVVNKNLPLDHEFIIRSKMEVTAIFKPVDEYVVTFMDTNGYLLDVQYVNTGETAIYEGVEYPSKPKLVVAKEPWGDVNLDNITEDKILVLNYERDTDKTLTLEYKDEPFMGEYKTKTYDYNDIAILEVSNADAFDYWKLNGEIISYDLEFSFSMLDDVKVEAFFSSETIEPEPSIIVSDNLE